jgi:hypothetical protein
MNKECIGILGKIFGHKFETYLMIETNVNPKIRIEKGEWNTINYTGNQENQYLIICKRCGCEPIKSNVTGCHLND